MKAFIAFVRRPEITTLILFACVLVSGPVLAQGDPGPNVNLIGLTPDADDIPDKYFRQQNEPSCAVRPGDSACIICAYNDYRTIDVFGDAWQGVSQSCDAGNSWFSRIAPGHPNDLVAPLPAAFAADPRLQAIPGMAILNFIAGYRDSNVGVLAIQHWLEVNKEDADHYEPGKITYIADEGTSGRFIDKPDMVAVLDPPANQGQITLLTEMENEDLGTIERSFPSGTLYVAYAVFTGSNSVKVLVNTSDDWGRTWKNQAMKLSEDQNQVSGITLTAIGGKVLAVWRRVGDNNNTDAIMYSVISNGGKKATKGEVLAQVCAFDQPTLGGTEATAIPMVAFRTNDFPWSANDDDNFYAFYSDRGRNADGTCDANGRPRIVTQYSSNGGVQWSDPITVSPEGHTNSFQFMPTAFGADGKIQVAWYDTRREAAELAAASQVIDPNIPYVADHVDTDLVTLGYVQRKVDVYTTRFTAAQLAAEAASPNSPDGIPDAVRASQYSIVLDDSSGEIERFETEASFANKKLFGQGKLPFLGDYIALSARQFRQTANGKWESNASASNDDEDFFAAWTDNRDVRGEVTGLTEPLEYQQQGDAGLIANATQDQTAADSTETQLLADTGLAPDTGPPRDTTRTAEGIDGDDTGAVFSCSAGSEASLERARDANIYGSLIKDRVRLYAPTPNKPLGGLQRAFVVSLANAEDQPRTYDLKITSNSCSNTSICRASFRQLPSTPDGTSYDLLSDSLHNDRNERITIPANSTVARTVFVVGAVPNPVVVQAFEAGTDTVVSTVQLGNAGVIFDPDVCGGDASCSVENSELHNLTLGNLTLGNLTLGNQAILNLTLGNLTLGNLTLGNETLDNLTLGNLTLGNLTLGNLTLGNAVLANPSLIEQGLDCVDCGFTIDTEYRDLLEWAMTEESGVDPALLNPALLAMTIDNPDELLNLTLGNLTLGNLTLGNLTLGNLTLGNLTLGNPSEPNLTLGNLTLGNLTLGNLTLGNSAIADPVLNETACPPNDDGTPNDCEVTGLTFDDYTYPITNKGNVTTAIDADITVEGEVAATQLIAWTANVTPTSVNCENILQMEERVQAVVNNPDANLEVANIGQPFNGEISTVAGPGETVFFTLRVFGTTTQLKNVTVGGFTASSQAANCIRTVDPDTGLEEIDCSNELNDGIEQIQLDRSPPVITLNGVSPMFVNVFSTYNEPGATAIDAVDGPVAVTVGGDTVNTSVLATYEVTYSATDNAGNSAEVSRWVTVVDSQPPGISQGDITVTVNATDPDPSGKTVSYTPTTSDNVGIKSVVCLRLVLYHRVHQPGQLYRRR
jgi:hypothetical protein